MVAEKTRKGYVLAGGGAGAPRTEAGSTGASDRSVTASWKRIEAWLAKHAPQYAKALPKGATAAAIDKLEKKIGLTMPAAARESWMRHNGNGFGPAIIGNWVLMDLDSIASEHKLMKQLCESGTFDEAEADPHPAITKKWWSTAWIPIVSSQSGHFFCIDTDPPEGGTPGQIILFLHDDGLRVLVAHSFEEWLAAIADDLERGIYTFDPNEERFSSEAFMKSSLERKDLYG